MNQRRKFRRAQKGEPLPPSWGNVAASERERTQRAMKAVTELLPGRGIVLLSAPDGASTEDVEAIACCTNFGSDGRQTAAQIFTAMLEWWAPDVMMAQPDRGCTRALREGVAAIRDIPLGEVLKQMPETLERLVDALQSMARVAQTVLQTGNRDAARATQQAIITNALQLATQALSIFDRVMPAQQAEEPPGPHLSGAPRREPMPPPREWPRGDTKTTLVADLRERPANEHRDQIIEMALAGKFHDYESETATPKALLVDLLSRFGFPDLAGKARDGGYDDERATVEQAEELRRDVGPEMFDALSPSAAGKRGQA